MLLFYYKNNSFCSQEKGQIILLYVEENYPIRLLTEALRWL